MGRTARFTFDDVRVRRPELLVHVDAIPRVDAAHESRPPPLADLIAAANAPGVGRVIVVTAREDSDLELCKLRRSGARYVIIRTPLVLDPARLAGKQLLVPRDRAGTPIALLDDVVKTIADAIADRTLMGQTIDVPASDRWSETVRPRVVAPWRAKLGRWLGRPVLAA